MTPQTIRHALLQGSAGANPYAALALAALFWSGNFVAGRALAGQIDPISLNFWRWALAAAVLLPVSWGVLAGSRQALRAGWRRIAFLGLTGVAGFHSCVYFALEATTAVNALMLLPLAPVAIALASWVATREPPGAWAAAGMVASLGGALVIVTHGSPDALAALRLDRGALWMLGGLAIGYIAVFASAIAFLLWIRAVGEIGPTRAGMFIHLMPVFGAILAAAVLGERIAAFHVVGAAHDFAALAIANRRPVIR